MVWYLAAAFKLWMLVDAMRRRVHVLWYVVLMVPFGDIVYFFAVKLRDFNVRESPQPGPAPNPPNPQMALAELERETELSPSFHNRTRLGWALLDHEQPERAAQCFELALRTHARDREALHGLGLSRFAAGDSAGAIEVLQRLVERSFAYEDYGAALTLAEALFGADRAAEAFELLGEVVRDSHRIEHRLLLARYQLRAARKTDACDTLRGALREFEAQPDFERRRNGAVATEARRLLRTLEEPSL